MTTPTPDAPGLPACTCAENEGCTGPCDRADYSTVPLEERLRIESAILDNATVQNRRLKAVLTLAADALSARPLPSDWVAVPPWADDLRAVIEAASEASAVPLTWLANQDFTPDQTKAWLCDAVDATVEDGAFSGSLHQIAEEETGHVVAFTGCGPKSAANAKFLIWCAHFLLKHKDALAAAPSAPAEVREMRVWQCPDCPTSVEYDGKSPPPCPRCDASMVLDPTAKTAPEPMAQGEASIAAAVSEAIHKLEDIAHRIAHVSPNVSEELVQLRTILLVGRLASPQPAADGAHKFRRLAQLLDGFDFRLGRNALLPPATYLDSVEITCEFQPGVGQTVIDAIVDLLATESRHD